MSDVPCGVCTACCRAFSIWMEPGDNVVLYRTVPVLGAMGRRMLARREDGACWYLTPSGCGIYEMRPKGCRRFDCRKWVERFPTRAERKQAIKTNPAARQVLERGRSLAALADAAPPLDDGETLPGPSGPGVFQGGLAEDAPQST